MILNKEQQKEMCQIYLSGTSLENLAKKYKIHTRTVARILKRNGQASRGNLKYPTNIEAFKSIKEKDAAYILGFLYADGYNDTGRGKVEITLAEKDRKLLEAIRDYISPTRPIYFKHKSTLGFKNANSQHEIRLYLPIPRLSKYLASLGLAQNKTFTLEFPSDDIVSENLLPHFVRGYFDGDGSMCISRNGQGVSYGKCGVISSNRFCEKYKEKLASIGIKGNTDPHPSDGMSSVVINKKGDILKFYNFLYSDGGIFMQRKYDKFIEFFNLKGVVFNAFR